MPANRKERPPEKAAKQGGAGVERLEASASTSQPRVAGKSRPARAVTRRSGRRSKPAAKPARHTTLESISLADGPVVITLTDARAARVAELDDPLS
jgi:hypothetical protein